MNTFDLILDSIKQELITSKIKLAFSEGCEPRVIGAVKKIIHEKLFKCILVGDGNQILEKLLNEGIKPESEYLEIVDPNFFQQNDALIDITHAIRQGKNSREDIMAWGLKANYFICMLIVANYAQAAIGGATYSTADTVRPALQIIKARDEIASSYMILVKDNAMYLFADCALNAYPTSEQLALIAEQTANSAKTWNIDPRVALLSFSTHKSATHPHVALVQNACQKLKDKNVAFKYDGEMQFDSAFSPEVAKVKIKTPSEVAGQANCFIFPNLDAGNIGYKIAQRMGSYLAVGPIIQGLKAPVNDLSRGASVNDIYLTAIITAYQALKAK